MDACNSACTCMARGRREAHASTRATGGLSGRGASWASAHPPWCDGRDCGRRSVRVGPCHSDRERLSCKPHGGAPWRGRGAVGQLRCWRCWPTQPQARSCGQVAGGVQASERGPRPAARGVRAGRRDRIGSTFTMSTCTGDGRAATLVWRGAPTRAHAIQCCVHLSMRRRKHSCACTACVCVCVSARTRVRTCTFSHAHSHAHMPTTARAHTHTHTHTSARARTHTSGDCIWRMKRQTGGAKSTTLRPA